MIRILLADDHPLTRSGLASWLEKEEGVELAALASDGESAWQSILELRPDLALLDIEMPGAGGIDIAARIRKNGLKTNVLMLTAYSAHQYVMASLRAGAKGFILKSAPWRNCGRRYSTRPGESSTSTPPCHSPEPTSRGKNFPRGRGKCSSLPGRGCPLPKWRLSSPSPSGPWLPT